MEQINFYILCRLCLKDSQFHSNIFEEHLMNDCLIHEILNEVYDLNISVGDGLPEFVCIQCRAMIKEFMLFRRKVHKGRSALTRLKQEMEIRNSGPLVLKREILPFQRDVDTQDEVTESRTFDYSSASVVPTSLNAEVITTDLITSEITIKEEPLEDEVIESQTSEYSSANVDPTSSSAEAISSDLITSGITVKVEPLEVEEFKFQELESSSKAVEGISSNTKEIFEDCVSKITGKEEPLQITLNQSIQFIESAKGRRKLLYEGYAYLIHRKRDRVIHWRCDKQKGCGGRLKTINDIVQGTPLAHAHPPDSARNFALQCVNKIRQKAKTSDEAISCIIRNCTSDVPLSVAVSLPNKEALARMISRKRAAIDSDKISKDH